MQYHVTLVLRTNIQLQRKEIIGHIKLEITNECGENMYFWCNFQDGCAQKRNENK